MANAINVALQMFEINVIVLIVLVHVFAWIVGGRQCVTRVASMLLFVILYLAQETVFFCQRNFPRLGRWIVRTFRRLLSRCSRQVSASTE